MVEVILILIGIAAIPCVIAVICCIAAASQEDEETKQNIKNYFFK